MNSELAEEKPLILKRKTFFPSEAAVTGYDQQGAAAALLACAKLCHEPAPPPPTLSPPWEGPCEERQLLLNLGGGGLTINTPRIIGSGLSHEAQWKRVNKLTGEYKVCVCGGGSLDRG